MLTRAHIAPLTKTQRTQRCCPRGGLARAQSRTRTAHNHGHHNTATKRFFYNAHNKLVRIEGRGFTNEFLYDSQNRRIGVKLSGTWRYDVHDGNLCIGSVVNGLLDRFFVRGAGIAEGTVDIIAEIPDPRNPSPHPYYYISNHRGDTLAVLDYLYNTAARYEYDAFGNVIEKTGTYTPRYTFSTKEYLSAAALYLYQYRAYDPIAGRWTQRDPIDYQDSINLYQFCGNNPIHRADVDGEVAPLIVILCVAGAIVVGGIGRYGWMQYWANQPINQGGVWAYTYVPGLPFTITGKNYRDLTDVGKYVVDEHEKVHNDGYWETAAHQRSYDLADEILARGEWNGKPLTENQAADLNHIRDTSRQHLEKRMGKKQFESWDKARQEKKADVYSKRKYL